MYVGPRRRVVLYTSTICLARLNCSGLHTLQSLLVLSFQQREATKVRQALFEEAKVEVNVDVK
jgi:hypothetical protein